MNYTAITILISSLGVIVAFIFSYLAFWRNKKTETQSAGENKGVMMSDIGYIKAGVDDLKRENRETAAKLSGVSERLTRCEESCKQAHHRIDEIKGE